MDTSLRAAECLSGFKLVPCLLNSIFYSIEPVSGLKDRVEIYNIPSKFRSAVQGNM